MQRVLATRNPALNLFGEGRHGFKAGNPATGEAATTPGFEWFNSLQEEIVSVIEDAGIEPDINNRTQLLTAIKSKMVTTVSAITNIDATALPDGSVVNAKGRDAIGDGGGGEFRYSAASQQAVDGVAVFAPAIGPGRFFRAGWTVLGFNGQVSVRWAGAKGDATDEYVPIERAFLFCVANRANLHFPTGTYSSGIKNMPFKQQVFPASNLLDCQNITISGDGPSTILMSNSASGADVLNLYAVKNIHFRNLKVEAVLTGYSASGSNGISLVGGWDNVTMDHIWCENLPYVDKGDYLDGGKALTVQPGTSALDCGTFKATNIFAKGCVYACGLEVDLDDWATKKHLIDIDIVGEDCYQGVVFAAPAASSALSRSMTMGFRVRARLINCQHNVSVTRGHGVDIEASLITTKTAAAKRLNPSGTPWSSTDAVVDGLITNYAKDSRFMIHGDIGGCDYKVQLGGGGAGASGFSGATDSCVIYVDLGGQAFVSDVNAINLGGNIVDNSELYISNATTSGALPAELYLPSRNNTVIKGSAQRLANLTLSNSLNFSYTDGVTSYSHLARDGFGMFFQQTGGSSNNIQVMGVKNQAGAVRFAIRNDGALITAGRGGATAVSGLKGIMPVYDETNALWGYVPVYQNYTP